MRDYFSLMIHGGAGDFSGISASKKRRYLRKIEQIVLVGYERLSAGASAVDVVEHCVMLLEDDPMFNAGRGSVLNEFGMVEMDAGIMEGTGQAAGAVAAVRQVRNPVCVARCLMEEGHHVLLVGAGAERYAREKGMRHEDDGYFITDDRIRQLRAAQRAGSVHLDHANGTTPPSQYSTVGAVARDARGHLAAATSTGGMTNKRWGRVGDSPLVGAGVFADDTRCAVSATGVGEHIMRFGLSRHIADLMDGIPEHSASAIERALSEFTRRLGGEAGVIVIDPAGQTFARFTTPGMIHGWITAGERPRSSIETGSG